MKSKQTIKTSHKSEFGDFQTPPELALAICQQIAKSGIKFRSVVEPTCGVGNILIAAVTGFESVERSVALELSSDYIENLKNRLHQDHLTDKVDLMEGDFFQTDWPHILASLPQPMLIIGNPPWVTSSHLGALGSSNLPVKSNFQNRSGLEAKMGKSNFDISEWMLIKLLDSLNGLQGCFAMLCKTAVARKLLLHTANANLAISSANIHKIDAKGHFNAAVDACLFSCLLTPDVRSYDCAVYPNFEQADPDSILGIRNGLLIAEISNYDQYAHLQGQEWYRWRSGVKHDASKVMELFKTDQGYQNGYGDVIDIEETYLYPMLKTSEVANGSLAPTRYMLIPQRFVGDQTNLIQSLAPKTWLYLKRYSDKLSSRASSIYRQQPDYAIFGIGDYSFAPYKVAVSGFYKSLGFRIVEAYHGKPIMLDDSTSFISCYSEEEAQLILKLLMSEPAQEFLLSLIFWDSKRPITIDILKRLDLLEVAKELGSEDQLNSYLRARSSTPIKMRQRKQSAYQDDLALAL